MGETVKEIAMQDKIQEALGLMKYRRFWHYDYSKKCDVICVDFANKLERDSIKFAEDMGQQLGKEAKRLREFVEFLQSSGVNAYVHHGPTGCLFAAIDTADKNILKNLL